MGKKDVVQFEPNLKQEDWLDDFTPLLWFEVDLCSKCEPLFDDCDDGNHGVEKILEKEGVLIRSECSKTDTESGLFSICFNTEETYLGFIERLNGFLKGN